MVFRDVLSQMQTAFLKNAGFWLCTSLKAYASALSDVKTASVSLLSRVV